MTGSIITKTNASGQSYFYTKLSYKNPLTRKWCQKMVATHLETKGNKRKADALKNEALKNYAYLEKLPDEYNTDIDPDITLCSYLDSWLHRKKANWNVLHMNHMNTVLHKYTVILRLQIHG